MKAKLNSLKAFDFDKANIHLWVFKKTSTAKNILHITYKQMGIFPPY